MNIALAGKPVWADASLRLCQILAGSRDVRHRSCPPVGSTTKDGIRNSWCCTPYKVPESGTASLKCGRVDRDGCHCREDVGRSTGRYRETASHQSLIARLRRHLMLTSFWEQKDAAYWRPRKVNPGSMITAQDSGASTLWGNWNTSWDGCAGPVSKPRCRWAVSLRATRMQEPSRVPRWKVSCFNTNNSS